MVKNWFLSQLAFYAAYHQDRRNQWTHHIGVPLIVFSLLLILSPLSLWQSPQGPVSAALIFLAVLLGFYIAMLPRLGLVALIFYGSLLYGADYLALHYHAYLWGLFGILFILGWAIQFAGHLFEGRRPALFDNILQIFMAPAFLIAEWFFAIGLEEDLKQELETRKISFLSQKKN